MALKPRFLSGGQRACFVAVVILLASCQLQHVTAGSDTPVDTSEQNANEDESSSNVVDGIKHVVILMLENRSFDHMCGFLKKLMSGVDGCLPEDPKCRNPSDPANPTEYYSVENDAQYCYKLQSVLSVISSQLRVCRARFVADADPDHSIEGTTFEIFGRDQQSPWPTNPPMSGFVKRYNHGNTTHNGADIMKCFDPTHVPAISTLAQEFAVFDRWFPAIPGPTMPNRIFAASGTSDGLGKNDVERLAEGMPQKTIFESFDEAKLPWGVYFEEAPSNLLFKYTRRPESLEKFHPLFQFQEHARQGVLPALSWLEPRYYELLGQPATDQHPNHDVSEGDALIKHVYDVLRASPRWNDTLLIVTYDEHGGFFDHVQPPHAPAPDEVASVDPPFDFTRVGVRIPTIMASPRIKKGTIVTKPGSGGTEAGPTPTSEFEASSMVATLRKMFNLPGPPLSNRSAWAGTFEHLVANPPRTDCPRTLPTPPVHRAMDMVPLVPFAQMGSAPLNELQQVFAQTFGRMTGEVLADSATEAEGAAFVAKQVNRILGRNVAGRAWPSQQQRVPYQ